ncbi:hypothetical protein EV360DRAFT_84871 [Lentinula raphanica]|nr:hypothetical protein EV360DRAFT_84871 [Lentinula raphanica]
MHFSLLNPGLSFKANLILILAGVLTVVGCVNGLPLPVSDAESSSSSSVESIAATSPPGEADKVVTVKFATVMNLKLPSGNVEKVDAASPLVFLTTKEQYIWNQHILSVVGNGLRHFSLLPSGTVFFKAPAWTFPVPDAKGTIKFTISDGIEDSSTVFKIIVQENSLTFQYGEQKHELGGLGIHTVLWKMLKKGLKLKSKALSAAESKAEESGKRKAGAME